MWMHIVSLFFFTVMGMKRSKGNSKLNTYSKLTQSKTCKLEQRKASCILKEWPHTCKNGNVRFYINITTDSI